MNTTKDIFDSDFAGLEQPRRSTNRKSLKRSKRILNLMIDDKHCMVVGNRTVVQYFFLTLGFARRSERSDQASREIFSEPRHGTRAKSFAKRYAHDVIHQQVEAIRDATYLGWTAESRNAYDDRLKQSCEIWERLGTAQRAGRSAA